MSLVVNHYLSEKLRALSLGAIVLVVLIHSYNEEVKFASGIMTGDQSILVLFIENFFSKGLARTAVPLFFTISGLLFYRTFEFTPKGIFEKLKGRVKSLFIPYLFWSVFGLIFILSLQLIPWSRNFFTKELIIHYSISKLLNTILLNPIPYQLWFIRDLIMLVICSPAIWYLVKSIKGVWLVILGFLWTVAPKTFELFSNEALFFFAVGCVLAVDKNEWLNFRLSKTVSYCLLILWFLIVLLTTSLLTFKQTTFGALNNIGVLTGLISLWSLYDHINQEHMARYSALYGYSFFIFVFHEPLLTILKKGMFFLLGKSSVTSLLIYLVAPIIAIGASMLIRYVLKRGTPAFYNFATGGR